MRNIKANRIVVKVGTNTLTNDVGMLDLKFMQSLCYQISEMKKMNKEVILVTSGAIGAGMKELNLKEKPKDVIMKQVCAGVGQNILMYNYYSVFARHGIKVAQILLKYGDFTNVKTFTNLKNSINKLLELGVVPIINENDPISIDEIGPSFGDNDNLSALIATRLKADLLIILTDVDGLYDKDPKDKNAVLIKEVKSVTKDIERMAGKPSKLGIGGMQSKIKAAKMATKSGVNAVIANGRMQNVIISVINGNEAGTVFHSKKINS